MFVTMNRIPVRPEYAEQFEEAFLGPNRLEAFEVVLDSEGRDG